LGLRRLAGVGDHADRRAVAIGRVALERAGALALADAVVGARLAEVGLAFIDLAVAVVVDAVARGLGLDVAVRVDRDVGPVVAAEAVRALAARGGARARPLGLAEVRRRGQPVVDEPVAVVVLAVADLVAGDRARAVLAAV